MYTGFAINCRQVKTFTHKIARIVSFVRSLKTGAQRYSNFPVFFKVLYRIENSDLLLKDHDSSLYNIKASLQRLNGSINITQDIAEFTT